ncbi:MAG: flagellar hook-basal body complex protein [Eubacteriales bacterium]
MRISTEYLDMLQSRIDTVANNIANVNTPGFKEGFIALEESYDAQERNVNASYYGGVIPGFQFDNINSNSYNGNRVNFDQGAILETGNPLDMAIYGEGFFQVKLPDGKTAYTRAGIFTTDKNNNLVNNEGYFVQPSINIPRDASNITVKNDGKIMGDIDGQTSVIGQIKLSSFDNPDGLEQMGGNLFLETDASGKPTEGIPGSGELGVIKGGTLEKSNADLVNAMTRLIETQRAYQFDLNVTQDQDEMFKMAMYLRG